MASTTPAAAAGAAGEGAGAAVTTGLPSGPSAAAPLSGFAPHAPPPPRSSAPRHNRPAPLGLRPYKSSLLTPPATPLHSHLLDGAGTDADADVLEKMAAGRTTTSKDSGLLDLFFLTFNCAKTPVDVDVFARHLRAALRENARAAHARRSASTRDGAARSEESQDEDEGATRAELPDLVVL